MYKYFIPNIKNEEEMLKMDMIIDGKLTYVDNNGYIRWEQNSKLVNLSKYKIDEPNCYKSNANSIFQIFGKKQHKENNDYETKIKYSCTDED